jgi:arsenate reductase-like glutaredoxin family protein
VAVRETANATKERYGADALDELFAGATELVVTKGKKVRAFDLKKEPMGSDELAAAVLGPTGNLRAPAIRTGKRWLIGFSEEAFDARFG